MCGFQTGLYRGSLGAREELLRLDLSSPFWGVCKKCRSLSSTQIYCIRIGRSVGAEVRILNKFLKVMWINLRFEDHGAGTFVCIRV